MNQDNIVETYADLLTKALRDAFGDCKLSMEPGPGLVTPDEIREVAWPIVAELHDELNKLPNGPVRLSVAMDKETREIEIVCDTVLARKLEELKPKPCQRDADFQEFVGESARIAGEPRIRPKE